MYRKEEVELSVLLKFHMHSFKAFVLYDGAVPEAQRYKTNAKL